MKLKSVVGSRKMKILIIQETNWVDRNVIHQHHLAERLAKRGHQIKIIDFNILWQVQKGINLWQPRKFFPEVNKVIDGVHLSVIRPASLNLPIISHVFWGIQSIREIRRLYKTFQFDIVIGLCLTNSYLIAQMLRKAGIPYIKILLEPYNTMTTATGLRPLLRAIERISLQAAEHIIVFTPRMQDYVYEMGVKQNHISCLKTGVNLDSIHPGLSGLEMRRKFAIPPDAWVIFFMGWLYDFSGIRQIVSAVIANPEILGNAYLLIVGDGDLYPELHTKINTAKPSQIILTGHQPYTAIPYLLAVANVCLLPSLLNATTRDIVPMKVYEYLASGRPVVATRLPGLIAEFGYDNGIMFTDNPLEALKKAVSLSVQPEQANKFGLAARFYAEKNADWEKTTSQFEELLTLQLVMRTNKGDQAGEQALSAADWR